MSDEETIILLNDVREEIRSFREDMTTQRRRIDDIERDIEDIRERLTYAISIIHEQQNK